MAPVTEEIETLERRLSVIVDQLAVDRIERERFLIELERTNNDEHQYLRDITALIDSMSLYMEERLEASKHSTDKNGHKSPNLITFTDRLFVESNIYKFTRGDIFNLLEMIIDLSLLKSINGGISCLIYLVALFLTNLAELGGVQSKYEFLTKFPFITEIIHPVNIRKVLRSGARIFVTICILKDFDEQSFLSRS